MLICSIDPRNLSYVVASNLPAADKMNVSDYILQSSVNWPKKQKTQKQLVNTLNISSSFDKNFDTLLINWVLSISLCGPSYRKKKFKFHMVCKYIWKLEKHFNCNEVSECTAIFS